MAIFRLHRAMIYTWRAIKGRFAGRALYAHITPSWPSVMNVWPYIADISGIMLVDGVLLRINLLLSGVEH